MGRWAKGLFGQETFSEIGVVVAGTSIEESEAKVLELFDEVISSKDRVFHAHLVKKDGVLYPIVFNVYGGPGMIDALAVMHDGGCRTLIFVGLAGGFKALQVGDVVLPDKSYHFDGIYAAIEPDRNVAYPDEALRQKLADLFHQKGIDRVTGTNISVPAVTLQPHAGVRRTVHPSTVEMELAACFSRSKDLGTRAAGALIVSDNVTHEFGTRDKNARERWGAARGRVLQTVIENLGAFRLPPLEIAEEFSLDKYFANYEYREKLKVEGIQQMSNSVYILRPVTATDYDFLYRLHVAAMRPSIEATWGWDDAFQEEYFRTLESIKSTNYRC